MKIKLDLWNPLRILSFVPSGGTLLTTRRAPLIRYPQIQVVKGS